MKPLIFVVNDDGIQAKGIYTLVNIAKSFGKVVVVAPDKHRSGTSQAVTTIEPLTIKEEKNIFSPEVVSYSCSGMPADCVKMGILEVVDQKPDLVLSGINHGGNHSVSVFYSGTIGAAFEGLFQGIPSIGFSLLNGDAQANFEYGTSYIKELIAYGLNHKEALSDHILNVNIPYHSDIKGIKICRQADARWKEEVIKRQNPMQEDYYWLGGRVNILDGTEGTDIWALKNNYISVVPVRIDLTYYEALPKLKNAFSQA